MPTVAMVAPSLDSVAESQAFQAINGQILRNPSFGNFFDLCGISLPMPTEGLPMGLMLLGRRGTDSRLLAAALAVETAIA